VSDAGADWEIVSAVAGGDAQFFKWGWDCETRRACVWPTGEPDGAPTHNDQLPRAWGRPPQSDRDVLGTAVVRGDGDSELVEITAYYGDRVPEAVAEWFRQTFPGHTRRH
jgi:hypothetical protein